MLAGAVALVTARAYASLTRRAGRSGGPYAYLREAGHPQLAAITTWLLVLGYVVALAVYAFTFGHYAAAVIGTGGTAARVAAVMILVAFAAINLRGAAASTLTEDAVVAAKLVILAVITGIGLLSWSSSRLDPLPSEGYFGVFVGAASIFVAFEGFELLSYDYDDIDDPNRTLPRALYFSVLTVIGIYVIVTLGSQMLVPDRLIIAQREVAFATVGQEALGTFGRWLATGAALLATSSAINATLFSTARLVRDLSNAHQAPARLGRTVRGIPTTAMWMLTLLSATFAMLPGINELLAFGSVTFLGVFALVNHLHARSADRTTDRILGHLGSIACVTAIIVVFVQLATDDPTALALIAGCLLSVGLLRWVFLRRRSRSGSAS